MEVCSVFPVDWNRLEYEMRWKDPRPEEIYAKFYENCMLMAEFEKEKCKGLSSSLQKYYDALLDRIGNEVVIVKVEIEEN